MNYGILFARDKLPGLVSNIALNEACNIINKPERDISEKGAGCISVSAFASLVGILVDTAKYIVGLKIWAITVAIKKYNSRKKNEWQNSVAREKQVKCFQSRNL